MIAKNPVVSPEELRVLLRYEEETGLLYWNERPAEFSASEAHSKRWNKTFAGKQVGPNRCVKTGYHRCCILGTHYMSHRVIWAMVHGVWPDGVIDHVNGDPTDNRIQNLRCVRPEDNARNRAIPITSSTGVLGVRWVEEKQKFRVAVSDGETRSVQIGFYDTLEHAEIAADAAYRALGYYKGHGKRRSAALIALEEAKQ